MNPNDHYSWRDDKEGFRPQDPGYGERHAHFAAPQGEQPRQSAEGQLPPPETPGQTEQVFSQSPPPPTPPAPQTGYPTVPPAPVQFGAMPPTAPGQQRSNGHNPYEFFLSSEPQAPRSTFGKNNPIKRLLVIVGGIGLLIVIGTLVAQLFLPKESARALYIALAQEQQEIIRVSTLGSQASSQNVQNIALTTQMSIQTNQTELLTYLASRNVKVPAKDLSLKQNPKTDKMLADAQATNTFDSALQQALATDLATYARDTQAAYKVSTGPKAKAILQKSYAAAVTLENQAANTTTSQ